MSDHEWLNTEQAARMFSDQWRLRALKYERALREIERALEFPYSGREQALATARAALDKPGTEVENNPNELKTTDRELGDGKTRYLTVDEQKALAEALRRSAT